MNDLRKAEIRRDERLLEHYGWERTEGLRSPIFKRGNHTIQLDAQEWAIHENGDLIWRDKLFPEWVLEEEKE